MKLTVKTYTLLLLSDEKEKIQRKRLIEWIIQLALVYWLNSEFYNVQKNMILTYFQYIISIYKYRKRIIVSYL